MEENEVTQDETQEQEQEQQLPKDASPDDLTLEELDQIDDDDFEKYHSRELSSKQIREKYNFTAPETEAEPEDTKKDEQDVVSTPSNNYEEYWKKISSPFKANGKMYQPNTPEDVVALMQKGVNYTQKMQQIAPYKKTVETLNKNNIDANELNFLIDLHNGNKDAIKSLLKRNKIDAMDLGTFDDNVQYTPNNNLASDRDVEVADVLNDIAENKQTIYDILYNKWDNQSRQTMIEHPELLRLLNEELQLGRFDAIQQQVEAAKMFGRDYGMNDLELYSAFARQYLQTQHQQFQQQQQQQQVQQQSEASSKRAAAPSGRTNVKAKGTTLSPNDILSMSEDDFNKIDLNKLLAKG